MGYGIINGKYSKQKINVKRSIESELVGIGEYVPYNILLMMLMSAKGYVIEKCYLSRQSKRDVYGKMDVNHAQETPDIYI